MRTSELARRIGKLIARLDQRQEQESREFETCWADEEVPGEDIYFRTEWTRELEGDEDEEHDSTTAAH